MFYAKHRSRRKKMKFVKGIAMLLCLVTIFTSVWVGNLGIGAEDGDRSETVKITVNYVYKSNNAMVAQPYTAQIEKGASFKKTLEVPKLFNYSIPNDEAIGLDTDSIVLTKDEATGKYSLAFDLQSVDKNIDVTLYYVAGTAKYTVYHYYQNLENDEYASDPTVVELTGDIDAYTQAVANNKPGYHCKGIPQTTIAADGTTKVEIYYDRDYYTVTFDVNGGVNGPEPIYAKYGTTFEAKDIKEPTRKGFNFLGWSPALSDTVTITGNVTYVAQWQPEKGQADYTIVLWGQNANDDEYSYLSSHEAWGNVGNQVTWNEGTLISHVHTDDCWELTCGKENHTHNDGCLTCGKTEHTHSANCYPGGSDVIVETYFSPRNPQNGLIYIFDIGIYKKSVVYFNGSWYEYNGSAKNGDIINMNCGKTEHSHSVDCYTCGKTEHTHDSSCGTLICGLSDTPKKYMSNIKPDSKLWEYERSDTVTVNADGSTVLNVYFTRTVFKLEFREAWSGSNDFGTIEARWGKDISAEYDAVVKKAGSSFWSENRNASEPWTNYIGVMPQRNITYYLHETSGSVKSTMTYYAEDLNGEDKQIFSLTFNGRNYTVSDEDRYEFEGFTYDHGTENGANCNGAKFYYRRNTYNLEFYSKSNSTPDRTNEVKYQNSLSQYDYVPTEKPDTVEADAVFVGWYLNPECTGERYDLAVHTMPANNIALYAKWVNGLYTVKTFTDEKMQTPYTYDGYTGVQEKIVKYTLATAPADPKKDGYQFIGWFYKDGETEKPFSFTMPITRDYDLYPKFSEPREVEYTVHYYKVGTTDKVADDRTNLVMIGTTVTEKAKMGKELDQLPSDQQNKYYPTKTSTSVIINQLNQEIIFYYTEATKVEYMVYYQDANGNDLIPAVKKTTEFSTVTEQYVAIPNYAPRQFSITKDLSSDATQNTIVFIYDPTLTTLTIQKSGAQEIDENQTFLFHVVGTDGNTKDIDLTVTVHGNGKTTIAELPVGEYTVTELTDWSWRYQPKNGEQTITLDPDGEKNVLTFENERKDGQWLSGDAYNTNLYKPDSN